MRSHRSSTEPTASTPETTMSIPHPTIAARRRLLPMIAPAVLALAVLSAPTAHADEATINGVVTEGDAPVADVSVSAYRLDDSTGG